MPGSPAEARPVGRACFEAGWDEMNEDVLHGEGRFEGRFRRGHSDVEQVLAKTLGQVWMMQSVCLEGPMGIGLTEIGTWDISQRFPAGIFRCR